MQNQPSNDALPPFLVSQQYANAHPSAPVPVPIKPGIASSEFWLHIVALLAPVIYNTLVHSDNVTVVAAAQAAASVYTLSRAIIKTQAVNNAQATSVAITMPATPPSSAPQTAPTAPGASS